MENFKPSPSLVAAADAAAAPREFAPWVAVIDLCGQVGPSDPVNLKEVRRQLILAEGCRHLHIRLTSSGGNISEADQIFRVLRSQPVPISARVSGKCYSAAMTIFAAADLRIAADKTEILIHPCSTTRESLPEGRLTAESLRAQADRLADIDRLEAQMFSDRTGHDESWFAKEMQDECLLSEADAIASGLVHHFEGMTGPPRPGWPAAVRAAQAAGGIYFPEWLRSANYFRACEVAGSLWETVP